MRGLMGNRAVGLVAVLVLTIVGSAGTARAGDLSRHPVDASARSSALDGKVFTGLFGAVGKPAKIKDSFIFHRGTFMSKQCEECGYPRGVYRIRRGQDGKTHFVAETPCPKTDARIVWRGTVADGRIQGVATWTRKRWYRTIQKTYWFKGRLVRDERAAAER